MSTIYNNQWLTAKHLKPPRHFHHCKSFAYNFNIELRIKKFFYGNESNACVVSLMLSMKRRRSSLPSVIR